MMTEKKRAERWINLKRSFTLLSGYANRVLMGIFGSRNERILNRIRPLVEQINRFEAEYKRLSDAQLREKSAQFRMRLQQGEQLDGLLPEAFAVVREASCRVFSLRHFDVQLLGGIALHQGAIAEMRTGEGKTLTATLPAYLNALTGRAVHIVTVNDYLARRDAENNRSLFAFLGLSVGINFSGLSMEEKKQAYAADVTYGTNSEFGFDYLRDNMVFDPQQRVQRGLDYAIVDEVDSILIDEARTPLVISGAVEDSLQLYTKINQLVPQLKQQEHEESEKNQGEGHFYVDEKAQQVYLTERGHRFVEELLIKNGLMEDRIELYSPTNIALLNHVKVALRAHTLFTRNVDYIVKDGEVVIVDEHTGRTMPGRRWSEGLHQAVEAKEGVAIQSENQTLAAITLQNYFRLYSKLAGMTGTAETEAFEFQHIYKLETVVIPTNRPMIRQDHPDLVYITEKEKFAAIIEEIKACVAAQRPTLVGTVSIERSEQLSSLLRKEGVWHQVLNAKFHAQEAEIIAQAGKPGAVTIATNMAGRGTDIVLGGNCQAEICKLKNPTPEQIEVIQSRWKQRHAQVVALGGLHIIGTERHESRRIDNQLRGRAGRQGDPGSSRFYLSLDDALMRIFANKKVINMMRNLGMEAGEVIEHPWVTRAIAKAQQKVENYHFDIRKQLLEFDDVANAQRKAIYAKRNTLLDAEEISAEIVQMHAEALSQLANRYVADQNSIPAWDLKGLEAVLSKEFHLNCNLTHWVEQNGECSVSTLCAYLRERIEEQQADQEKEITPALVRNFEKRITLRVLDSHWRDHLATMEHLRQGIHLCGYAQKDPKQEYKHRSFELFEEMLRSLHYTVVTTLARWRLHVPEMVAIMQKEMIEGAPHPYLHAQPVEKSMADDKLSQKSPRGRTEIKIGRNTPCPCGSGKKYKQCHGQLT